MALNLSVSGGDFVPFIKYNAKSSRWSIKVKAFDGRTDEIIVPEPRLVMDFAHAKAGWIGYPVGAAPIKVWDVGGVRQPQPQQPGVNFKQGFLVLVYGPDPLKELAGAALGLREFSSNANAVIGGIKAADAAFEAGLAQNPGKMPVFKIDGYLTISGKQGNNYQPNFVLEQWVDRADYPAFDEAYSRAAAAPPSAAPTLPIVGLGGQRAATPVAPPLPRVTPSLNMGKVDF